VLINVMFNTVNLCPLFLNGPRKINYECGKMIDLGKLFQITSGELYENCHYRADFSFEL
jgi:hypothetical protein